MSVATSLASATVRTAGAVSPRGATAIVLPIFMHVGAPVAVRRDAELTMLRASRSRLHVVGLARTPAEVVVYQWGRGDRVVVLAHGWRGRASQFATLVRELVYEGYRVVAFDAPAHGDSAGRHTYLIDWVDIFRALRARHGSFHAVVGHSFGALAALIGVADGIGTERVVTVAAPADADTLLTQFRRVLRHDDRTAAALRDRFARRFFPVEADPFRYLSAVERPLPVGIPLLVVHDELDRQVPFAEADRIARANPGAQMLATSGLGHGRILEADVFLDGVLAHLAEPSTHTADAPVQSSTPVRPAAAGRVLRPRETVSI